MISGYSNSGLAKIIKGWASSGNLLIQGEILMSKLSGLKDIPTTRAQDQSFPGIIVGIIEGDGLFRSKKYIYTILLVSLLAGEWLLSFAAYRSQEAQAIKYTFKDFDCFYLASQLAAEGKAVSAYVWEQISAFEYAVSGKKIFLPFTYPPPYLLLLEAMSAFRKSTAYLLFSGISLVAYLVILKRLARSNFNAILILLFPSIVFCLSLGQSGLLFGALAGFVVQQLLAQRAFAGLPLGLMAIKPHLAIAIGFQILCDWRWKVLSCAALTLLLLAIISTFYLGASIWPAFLGAVNDSREFLARGYYPLHRMVSLYAVLRPLGFSLGATMLVQFIQAVVVLLTIYLASRKSGTQIAIGVACQASPLISPYAYDYDLPIVGIGLAILLPELLLLTNSGQRFFLYIPLFFAGLLGLVQQIKLAMEVGDGEFKPFEYMSVSGIFLQWFFWMTSYYLVCGGKPAQDTPKSSIGVSETRPSSP